MPVGLMPLRRMSWSVAPACLALALALSHARTAAAQVPLLYTLSGQQNPPGIHWRRIDSPHFTVIYPDSLAREAQRATTLLERAYEPLTKTLRAKPERIPVVLNSHSMVSNAYVAWGPRRSQWYAMPNTTVDAMGPMDWYSLLAVHEGRHIVQQRAVRTGLIGVLDRLFGDNTTFFAGALYFPAWFWEGDAVGTETALTADGRGRQPSFTQRIRALRLSGKPYEYYPAWEGSYRTLYPDWYELGYVITTHVRRTYGDSVWRRAIVRAARNPLAPMALSRALKRETGHSLVELHREAVRALDTLWREQQATVRETAAIIRSPRSGDYREWLMPQYAADGSLIAAYSDLGTVKRLVRLTKEGKRETLLERVGLYGELQFHVRGNSVVWSEYEVSPRWGEENFLVVKSLDITTRKLRRLTDRSRYFGPALSPDGQRIVAVHFSPSRVATLVILDASTGAEAQRVPNASGNFLVTPTWAPDGKSVVVVAVHPSRGNALVRVPLDGASADTLLPFTHDAISRPVISGTRLYFGSPRSGIDNIYVLDTATRVIQQVTSRKYGAMFAGVSPDGRSLAFSDYSVAGHDVGEMPLDSLAWTSLGDVTTRPIGFADPLIAQEVGKSILDSLPTREWPSAPFAGWSRFFNFHSLSISPTSDGVSTGFVFESKNLLNTLGLVAGPLFNVNERTTAFEIGASYAGLPLILDVAGRVGARASSYTDSSGTAVGYRWNERSMNASLRLPLTRLMGQTRQSLLASASIGRTHISDLPVQFRFDNNNGDFNALTYGLSASHVRPRAYRDLYPVGAVASGVYRHTPLGSDYRSHQASIRGGLYLPGLFAHHALVLDAARETQRPGNYRFSSQYLFPRGYRARFHEEFTRVGAAYHLPLWYPDLALGPWLYVRRVQGAVLGDIGRGRARDGSRVSDYRSVSGEVTADISPFGLRTTVRAGIRLSRPLTGANKSLTEFILILQ